MVWVGKKEQKVGELKVQVWLRKASFSAETDIWSVESVENRKSDRVHLIWLSYYWLMIFWCSCEVWFNYWRILVKRGTRTQNFQTSSTQFLASFSLTIRLSQHKIHTHFHTLCFLPSCQMLSIIKYLIIQFFIFFYVNYFKTFFSIY